MFVYIHLNKSLNCEFNYLDEDLFSGVDYLSKDKQSSPSYISIIFVLSVSATTDFKASVSSNVSIPKTFPDKI